MSAQHTPGPWRIGTPPPSGEQTIGTMRGMMVAVAVTGVGMVEETLANARLIAAAPELLEALKQCRLALEPYDDVKPRDWKTDRENLAFAHQAACAAIAKATGGAA